MIDRETSRVAARVVMSWAASRAEAAASDGFRRDVRRSFDGLDLRWRRRRARAVVTTGFAVAAALAVAAAGQRRSPQPRG